MLFLVVGTIWVKTLLLLCPIIGVYTDKRTINSSDRYEGIKPNLKKRALRHRDRLESRSIFQGSYHRQRAHMAFEW